MKANKFILSFILLTLFVSPSFCQCNVNVEQYPNTEPGCYVWNNIYYTIYWGGISGSATYAALGGTCDCEYAFYCFSNFGENSYCAPLFSYHTGYTGPIQAPTGAYWTGSVWDYDAHSTTYNCASGEPGFEGLGVGFEVYCTARYFDSTTLFGPCN